MHAAEPLPHFVDDYLSFLYEVHPTGATMDGVHVHDDLVEDFRRIGDRHARERARRVRAASRRHSGRAAAASASRSSTRSSRRTSARGSSSSKRRDRGSATRTSTPTRWRRASRRRRFSTTRPRPNAPAASCRSCGRCRGWCRRRATTSRTRRRCSSRSASTPGAARCRSSTPICRARSQTSTICTCSAISPMRAPKPCRRSAPTSTDLETEVRPKAKGSFRLGRERSSRSCGSTRASRCRSIGCWRSPTRELAGHAGGIPHARRPAERRRSDRRRGARRSRSIREPGTLIATAREQLDELHTFLSRNPVVSMPDSAGVAVAPTPEFFRWSSASMWTPGPFESKPSRAMYYLTDVDPKWEDDRKREHLRDFNLPTLWTISIHEVYPGPLPALPAPAEGRLEGPPLDDVRAGVVHRRLGALLRADDARGRIRPGRSHDEARPARRSAGPPRAVRRRHPAAHRGLVGGAGRAVFPRRSVSRGVQRAARSRARHVRSDLSRLLSRQDDAAEAAPRLVRATGRQAVAARVSRRAARAGLRAVLGAAPADAGRAITTSCLE